MESRRVKITKKILQEPLIELLQSLKLEQITIKMLCENADVNRSTFYAHYESIYDLFDQIEDDFIEHIAFYTSNMDEKKKKERTLQYVHYVYEKKNTFYALMQNGHFPIKFQKLSHQYAGSQGGVMGQGRNLMVSYTVTGTIALLSEWLENTEQVSAEKIADIILKMSDYAEMMCNEKL